MTSAAKEGGPSIALAYDALDRLVQRTKDATATTTYAYAGTTEELVSESAGGVTTLYASILGEPLAQRRGTEVRFLGLDPHGDVAYLADPSGAPVGWRTYGPWGEVRQASGEPSTLGFQGDPTDPDTGLVDMGARLYAPGLGRFTSLDPLAGSPTDPLSLNRFLYAEADPVSLVDPTGLRPAFCSGPGGACGGSSGSIRDHRRGMSWYTPKAQTRTTRSLASPNVRTYIRAVEDEVRRYVPRVQPRPNPQPSRRARPSDPAVLLRSPASTSTLAHSPLNSDRADCGYLEVGCAVDKVAQGVRAAWDGTKRIAGVAYRKALLPAGRQLAAGASVVARCFANIPTCAHNIEIAVSPIVSAGATVTLAVGLKAACATGIGCAVGMAYLVPGIGAGAVATYRLAREVWFGPDRKDIYHEL